MTIDADYAVALALRSRMNELAAHSRLPATFAQSSQLQSAWASASPALRKRVLSRHLDLERFRLIAAASTHVDIAVLPCQALRRLLLFRALYSRIDALRRCVDRRSRQWFIEQLGESGWQWILSRFASPSVLTLLPTGDDHLPGWYNDGWYRLYRDRIWDWRGVAYLAANVAQVSVGLQPDLEAGSADQRSAAFLNEWRVWTESLLLVEAAA